MRAARAIWNRLFGEEYPDTLRADRALAGLLRIKGQFSKAEALLRETAGTQNRVLGKEHADTLATMTELALVLWGPGRFEEAESIHRQVLKVQRRVLGEEHVDTVNSLGHLGAVCRALGKIAEADSLLRRALELSRRVLGEDHPCTATAMNNLGLLLEDQGRYEQAETLLRRTYELDRRILGPDHPQTLFPLNDLLRILHRQGKAEAIRPMVAERIAHLRRAAGRPDATALALHAYVWELLNCEVIDLRDPEAALPVAEQAVDRVGGGDVNLLVTLALAYQRTGHLDQAIETQRRAIASARAGGLHDRATLEARLLDYLLEAGDFYGAVSVSWEGVASSLRDWVIPGAIPNAPLVLQSEALMKEGRFNEAVEVLRGCLSMRRKTLPKGHWLIAEAMSRLGGALAGEGEFVLAEPLLLEAYTALKGNPQVTMDYKRQAIQRIIQLHESRGKPDKASAWRQRLGETADSDGVVED